MTAIVGHGPSMLGERYGDEIDQHDVVIRQKRCQETLKLPEQYGTKTDVVCGSFTIANQLPAQMPGNEYWAFIDSRHKNVSEEQLAAMRISLPCIILPTLCDEWNERYRQMREPYDLPPGVKKFDDLGHPHMSAGLHTILYACEILGPKQIDLYGFDNVQSGSFTWSITRGPEWDAYPDHNWPIEHKMIPMIENEYKVELRFR